MNILENLLSVISDICGNLCVLMYVQAGNTTDGNLDESLILEIVADGGKVCLYKLLHLVLRSI